MSYEKIQISYILQTVKFPVSVHRKQQNSCHELAPHKGRLEFAAFSIDQYRIMYMGNIPSTLQMPYRMQTHTQ